MQNLIKLLVRASGIILVALAFTSCSSMGKAVVTEVDGQPCFAIEKTWSSRNGLPMHGLTVVQRDSPGARPYSKSVWTFRVEPPGSAIITRPEKCMPYGVTPEGATQKTLMPLEPYQVYSVAIAAAPENSGMIAHTAEFCVKPAPAGQPRVITVIFDEKTSTRRYDLVRSTAVKIRIRFQMPKKATVAA